MHFLRKVSFVLLITLIASSCTEDADLLKTSTSLDGEYQILYPGDEMEPGVSYKLSDGEWPLPEHYIKQIAEKTASNARTTSTAGPFFDSSGDLEVKFFYATSPSQTWNFETSDVDEGYILVGGGAWADYGNGPGALLVESRPLDKTTWMAASKDHIRGNPHRLHVCAIGLKIRGKSFNEMVQLVDIYRQQSAFAPHPTTSVPIPDSQALTGGGATTPLFSGSAGSLLVHSYPTAVSLQLTVARGVEWNVKSKDHIRSNPAWIRASAIAIDRNIPGIGQVNSLILPTWPDVQVSSGVAIATSSVAGLNGVLTGIGGKSEYSSQGRLLTKMWPLDRDRVEVRSKDHVRTDPGLIHAYAIALRKLQQY